MFLTSLGAFLVFTMEDSVEALGDKYGLLITLLLAAVAVQFVVASYVCYKHLINFVDIFYIVN